MNTDGTEKRGKEKKGKEGKKREEGQWCPIVRAHPSRRRRAKDGPPLS
jgi:hypothetical protein